MMTNTKNYWFLWNTCCERLLRYHGTGCVIPQYMNGNKSLLISVKEGNAQYDFLFTWTSLILCLYFRLSFFNVKLIIFIILNWRTDNIVKYQYFVCNTWQYACIILDFCLAYISLFWTRTTSHLQPHFITTEELILITCI